MNRYPSRTIRQILAGLALGVLLTVTAGGPAASSPPDRPASLPAGYVMLVAQHSGKCLTIDPGQPATFGGPVTQWTCGRSATGQLWRFISVGRGYYRIATAFNGNCLSVFTKSSRQDGAQVWQQGCAQAPNHEWRLVGGGAGLVRLVARHSGKCLTIDGGSRANGAWITQSACSGANNQLWRVRTP